MAKINTLENKNQILFGASYLTLVLLENWGCSHSIGLTGLEVFDGDDPILLHPNQLSCSLENQDLYRLINGMNVTSNCNKMWLLPFSDEDVVITIDLNGFKYLSGEYKTN